MLLVVNGAELPRALAAVDAQHPEGTVGRAHNDYTVLQQHCAFFDRDGDGVIFPQETYQGFRALGYPPTISVLAAIVINGSFSYPTYDVRPNKPHASAFSTYNTSELIRQMRKYV
jgi:hypothetical protein